MSATKSFGTCKGCGKRIVWVKMKSGKNMPCDCSIVNNPTVWHPFTKQISHRADKYISALLSYVIIQAVFVECRLKIKWYCGQKIKFGEPPKVKMITISMKAGGLNA